MIDVEFLSYKGFKEPKIVEDSFNGMEIIYKRSSSNGLMIYLLYQDGDQWMCYEPINKKQVFEFYSHWNLAQGHCICTGMGFLLRESWLLSKKEVTKITVIEKNQNIIDYHWKHNPEIMKHLEVVRMDVYDYRGSCDTLLIDNFEGAVHLEIMLLKSVKQICGNINHKTMWFWPFELVLKNHYKNFLRLTLSEIYEKYRKYYGLNTLPDLSEDKLYDFCYAFSNGNMERCDFNKVTME